MAHGDKHTPIPPAAGEGGVQAPARKNERLQLADSSRTQADRRLTAAAAQPTVIVRWSASGRGCVEKLKEHAGQPHPAALSRIFYQR